MLPLWFMWLQVASCWTAAGMLAKNQQWWMAWVWFCYGLANVGFVGLTNAGMHGL